jgi:hypothetical protein
LSATNINITKLTTEHVPNFYAKYSCQLACSPWGPNGATLMAVEDCCARIQGEKRMETILSIEY